ncbi:hypothetical protein HY212_03885, partial [Candidatus Pacearchaeota archaeon]|nr:hypothetical protein [Candidatus Pacearchaeota archaeon]
MNKSQIKIYPLLFVASCMFYNHSRSDEPSPTQAAPADIAEKEKGKQTAEKPKIEISFDAQYDSSSKLLKIFTETNNTYNFSMDLSTDDGKQLQKLETIIHYMNLKAKEKKEATLYLISKAKKIFDIDLGLGDYDISDLKQKDKLKEEHERIKGLVETDAKKISFNQALETLYKVLEEFSMNISSSQIKTDKTNFSISLLNYGSFDFLVTDNSAISFNNNISIFKKFKLKGTDLIYDFVYNQVSKQIIIIPAQNNNNTLDTLSAKPCQDWSDQDQKQFQSTQTQNGLRFACINFENTNPFVNMSSNLTLNNKSYKFSLKTDKDDQYLFSLNQNGTLNNNQHETFQIDTVSGVLKKNAANSPYSFTASLHKLEGMIQGSHFRADISENNPLNTLLNLNSKHNGSFSLDFSGFPQANGDNVAIAPLKTRFRLFDKLNRNVGNGAMSFESLTLSHDNTSSSFVMQNAGFQITSKLPFERIGSQESPKPRDDGGLEFATEFLSFKKFSQNNNDLEFEDLATSKFSATGGIGQMILIDKVKQTQAEGKIWTHFENARIQFINASNSDKLGFISLLTGIGQIKTTDFTELQITNGKKDADGNMQNGFSVRKGLLDIVNDMAVAAR